MEITEADPSTPYTIPTLWIPDLVPGVNTFLGALSSFDLKGIVYSIGFSIGYSIGYSIGVHIYDTSGQIYLLSDVN